MGTLLLFKLHFSAADATTEEIIKPVSKKNIEFPVTYVVLELLRVAGFAWSWGPLGWLVPSEIFPLEIRYAAQSINVSVNMLFTFIIAQIFLVMYCHWKFVLFIFFAFFVMVMTTIFIYFFLPETKNVPNEESKVWKQHWFWSKYVTDEDYPDHGETATV